MRIVAASLICLFVLVGAPLVACDKCGAKGTDENPRDQGDDKDKDGHYVRVRKTEKVYVVTIPDVACGNCSKVVKTAIKEIDGVVSVTGDSKTKKFVVKMRPGKTLKQKDVQGVVRGKGYTFGGMVEKKSNAAKKTDNAAKKAAAKEGSNK